MTPNRRYLKRLANALLANFCIAVLLSLSSGAHAGLIYNVDRAVGAGSVVGTIETDGTLGVLAQVNVLSFSLTLHDGTDSATISSATGGFFLLQNRRSICFRQRLHNCCLISPKPDSFLSALKRLSLLHIGGNGSCKTMRALKVSVFNTPTTTLSFIKRITRIRLES